MKKEKIGELAYKGYLTEFFITPKIKEFLKKNNASIEKLIPKPEIWYEVMLFENLDEDEDGRPDSSFGKKFNVVFYKIVTKRALNSEQKIEDDLNDYLKNAILFSTSKVFNFEVDFVVVKGMEK